MRTKSAFVFIALFLGPLAAFGAWFEYNEYHRDCCAPPEEEMAGYTPPLIAAEARAPLGLMSSLPLLWPVDADVSAIADGTAEFPWQAAAFNAEHEVTALDTLSPMPGLTPDAPEVDPLEGLDRLAVIQPRALTPQDNVALDEWVRAGGKLFLVLDPLLTGQYDLPLGDPRRPADTALIPPVLARWGLEMRFVEDQKPSREVPMLPETGDYRVFFAGTLTTLGDAGTNCTISAEGVLAVCDVGEGRVTVLADAGLIEHGLWRDGAIPSEPESGNNSGEFATENGYEELAWRGGEPIIALLRFAFSD